MHTVLIYILVVWVSVSYEQSWCETEAITDTEVEQCEMAFPEMYER